ncbi:unnamed protein product [Amaranthus hypochondriacus]
MKEKSEEFSKLQQVKEAVEKEVGRKVQYLRTDNGGEYTSAEFSQYLQDSTHVTNRLPQARLEFVSSYEKLWKIKPVVSHFRVFGCVCYVFVPEHLRRKFDKKAIRCIFVGYDDQRKGWKCCDPTTNKCLVLRNVVFDEASSWWSPQAVLLLDSKEIDEKLLEKMEDQPSQDVDLECESSQTSPKGKEKSP